MKKPDLFAHLDDDVRVAATHVADGEIDAALDADSEEPQQTFH